MSFLLKRIGSHLFRCQASPTFTSCSSHLLSSYRAISNKQYDPKIVAQISSRIEEEKTYEDVLLENYVKCYQHDDEAKDRVKNVIDIYDNMKYDLEDVPTNISQWNMNRLIQCESHSDIRRHLKKLSNKEKNGLIMKELKKLKPQREEKEWDFGIFDEQQNLRYGLWRNTMFTRMPKENRARFSMDRARNSELFGQNLFIDMSFSEHLSQHLSSYVADDLGKLLSHNRNDLDEPFRIVLCGIDYDSHLWKALSKAFSKVLEFTPQTTELYHEMFPEKKQLVYITGLEERDFLNYDPSASYVMAAISERDIQHDYLIPAIRKNGIKCVGIPIDQHVLWNSGSKRQNLFTRLKLLNDVRNQISWRDALNTHIRQTKLKSAQQVIDEENQRLEKLAQKPVKKKKKPQKKNVL